MSFIKICNRLFRIGVIFALFLAATVAVANEGGGEAAAGGSEKVEKREKSQAVEYIEKTTKLNTLQARVMDADKDFAKLVEEKEHEKNPRKLEEILKEMVQISKRRDKDVEDYNKVRQELLYQYPSKNVELKRMYQTEEKKTLEEMQSSADIDSMLSRVKKVIERKFAPFNPENEKPKPKPASAQVTNPEDAPKKLRLEK